mgnify:CR=1 FL=1|tara:strand:- start:13403 stop:14320 length:918 start_codon:yes stop_codon:yes gene_type:complete
MDKLTKMDLSIVIVSWNTQNLLKSCLKSIIQFTKNIKYEIIVIDNASNDGSVGMIQSQFPSVILIKNKENVGFSKANNQGIRIAKGEHIVLLNSDTYITENSFYKMFIYMKENKEVGICGPKVLNPDHSPQSTRVDQFKPFDTFLKITGLYNYKKEVERMDYNRVQKVEVIGGCCMFFRKKVFDTVGLLDEHYFLYNEENDICLRAKKIKWEIVFYPVSTIFHFKGSSTSQKEISEKVEIACYKSNMHFFKKYFSKQTYFLLLLTYKGVFLIKFLELFFLYLISSPSKKNKIKEKKRLKWCLLTT